MNRRKPAPLLLAVLFGIILIIAGCGGGDDNGDGSGGATQAITSGLSQAACGASPTVLLRVHTSNTERQGTQGWVIYRAADNPYFPPIPGNIIDVFPGRDLPSNTYSDDPYLRNYVEDAGFTYYYVDAEDLQEATVTAAYNHYPMTPGGRYYYCVRRIIQPLQPPGYNPPVVSQQVQPSGPVPSQQSPVVAELEVEVESGQPLSQVSNHFGPITFFVPPQLSSPLSGTANQSVTDVPFTWQPTTGADVYRVELFGPTDPQGRGNPYWVSDYIQGSAGSSAMSATFSVPHPASGLTPDTTYYWRVGARASGDISYPSNRDLGKVGWLYSYMRSFSTVSSPPGSP